MAEDKHSKTEKPTAKRKSEAQKKGQLARSQDLLAWTSVLVATYLLSTTVRHAYALLDTVMGRASDAIARPDVSRDMAVLTSALEGTATVLAPLLGTLMIVGVAGNFAQVGFKPSLHGITPSFSKLNPMNGIKRVLSPHGGWDAAKNIMKVAVLGAFGWTYLHSLIAGLTSGGALNIAGVGTLVASKVMSMVRITAMCGLGLAALDYMLSRRRTAKGMMMTKQAVKEEAKQADVNPLIKGAQRKKQRSMSRLRMIAAVASADAVVVNPTHVAVALKYEPGAGAPRVVAKGADVLAARIRAEAAEHQVPVVEEVALARALYIACELEAEIPAQLYEAVARLLAFIFSLKSRGRAFRVDGEPLQPPAPLLTGALAEEAMAGTGLRRRR